ncbi:MAG TPA: hypothetical protein VHC44_17875 [Verrucomicrobiae bacterium]|nr:hypothetical protein [Verrucomicrobiae bacterium]
MKTNLLKGVGLLSVLAVLGVVWIAGIKAQPVAGGSSSSLITTNWVGCLVVGKPDPVDNMARGTQGLFPAAVHQVQIGLRSDGVVVWRNAENQ